MNAYTQTSVAPHAGRSILLAPGRRINLASAGYKLASYKPRTKLGALALDVAMASTTSAISVAATSAYVYALTEAAPPPISFVDPPPGTTISVQSLQTEYEAFKTQFALFQGEASAWINTQTGTSTPSILSQLVSVPNTFNSINDTVLSYFTLLGALTPGTPEYQSNLNTLTTLINAELAPINSLNQQMKTLGTNLETAADTLQTDATTGVLYQLQQAYASEIAAFNADIAADNATIAEDNKKIIEIGAGLAASLVLGLIGLANIWNPLGWLYLAGAAVGAYFAVAEIATLKGDIKILNGEIKNYTDELYTDETAAKSVSAFSNLVSGFASMNAAAQVELTTLETLYSTLAADITDALGDLSSEELTEAQQEWTDIVTAANVLANINAFVWPTPIMLSNPTSFAATTNGAYAIDMSGQVYHYVTGANTWSEVSQMSLSVVARGSLVAGINGAPINGTTVTPTPYATDFLVKTYDAEADSWTTISAFPAAQIATDGTSIYAINQTQSDRQAYLYSGSGTSWTAQTAMPNTDAPGNIAVSSGSLLAIANNSMLAYILKNGTWQQIGGTAQTFVAMAANGGKVGFIDGSSNGFVYDTASGTMTATMSSVIKLTQLTSGDQFAIDSNLNLYHVDNQVSPATATQLVSNVVGVYASETDVVYRTDGDGNSYVLADLASNSWSLLPAFPTSEATSEN